MFTVKLYLSYKMEGKKSPCCQSEMCKTIETFNNTCYFHRAWTKKKKSQCAVIAGDTRTWQIRYLERGVLQVLFVTCC